MPESMSCSRAILYPPEEPDKISELPDDILLKFISVMDLQNAVQASVLAKRWRYLWTWRIDLNLHHDNMPWSNDKFAVSEDNVPEEYINWVNQVIDAHQAPCIRKFTLCALWNIDNSLLEKWVRFAFSKRVEELDLSVGSHSENPIFSMGFDILKHSPINGTFNLKSLRLNCVDVSGEAIEYILLKSPLLELLCVNNSETLHTLHIVSDKLKHLTLMRCRHMKNLEIDAVNLISFELSEPDGIISRPTYMPHIVFKRVPNLVEVSLTGKGFFRPFHLLKHISPISNQLTKLSFHPDMVVRLKGELSGDYFDTVKKNLLFCNVKHINVEVYHLKPATMFIKFLIDICPKLHGVKLNIQAGEHAIRQPLNANLQREIKHIDEKSNKVAMDINMPDNDIKARDDFFYCAFDYQNIGNPSVRYKNQCHSNLKVLEVNNDFEFATYIIACAAAHSFETLICTRRYCPLSKILLKNYDADFATYNDSTSIRVRNHALFLAPRRIHVGIRDADSARLFWFS